ncbi:MAG TPA: putative peptidoglycan glycosyltransferase FtsW [Solirubrobacteraceae bacterium]|jgi:cell division protein FtsW
MASRATGRLAPPLEHRILVTVTLCLLAFGAVMVFSASSSTGVLGGSSYGTSELFMYLLAAGLGLIAMRLGERRGLELLTERTVRLLLLGSFALLLAVMIPGIGRDINGARRWFAFGPIQFQPSELMKLVLVLYVARYLADHPRRLRGFKQTVAPIAVVIAPACLLIATEPDLGTMLVVVFTVGALMLAAGIPLRYLAIIAGAVGFIVLLMVMASSYQRARLLSFLHPWAASCKSGPCYQAVQGQIAVGSGGIFGVGLGKSVQKAYYLPEAQTDFILAVIGEELGVLGIFGVVCLYGMIAFAGLRTARRAATRYAKLLASGLTSLILCQGVLNIFVVLGIAPLTGVPLPFISYAPTNLCMMLIAVGLLLGIARPPARELRSVDDGGGSQRAADWRDGASDSDRRGRHGGARRTGAGGRRRAAG